jgi:hypothetical protein
MTRYHFITNAKTGQTTQVAFTPEEEAAADLATRPKASDLNAERERRISLPLDIVGLSVGPIAINMDAFSQRNLQGLATVGMQMKLAGLTDVTEFKAYDNNLYDLTPDDLIAMGLQTAARVQACYRAEWALKDTDPIPLDYTDDQYWP